MWMRETYKGLASGIIYASKGDQVNVIRKDVDMTFLECNGQKFHVRNERLSTTPVEAAEEFTEPLITKPQPKNHSKKPTKSYSQKQLF